MTPETLGLIHLALEFVAVPAVIMLWKIERRLFRVELALFEELS